MLDARPATRCRTRCRRRAPRRARPPRPRQCRGRRRGGSGRRPATPRRRGELRPQRPGPLPRLDDGGEHARSIPARSSSAPSQSPVLGAQHRRRAGDRALGAALAGQPERPQVGHQQRGRAVGRLQPRGWRSPSRKTVLIGCGSTPVRAKRSSAGIALEHPLARGAVGRAIVAGRLEQPAVVIDEPVVHAPGADRDPAGGSAASQPAARPASVASNRPSTSQRRPSSPSTGRFAKRWTSRTSRRPSLEPAGGHAPARRAEVDCEVATHAQTAV